MSAQREQTERGSHALQAENRLRSTIVRFIGTIVSRK